MDRAEETIDTDEVSFAPALDDAAREEARRKLEALRGAPLDAPSRLPVSKGDEEEPVEEQKAEKAPAVRTEANAAFFRPVKVRLTTRVDADVLAAFKATGKGWQTLLNDVLRKNMPG